MLFNRLAVAAVAGLLLSSSVRAEVPVRQPGSLIAPTLPAGTTVVPVTNGMQGNVNIGGPGNWNMNNIFQSNSDVMKDIIAQTAKLQDQDRVYLQSIVDSFNRQLADLVSVQTKWQSLADFSQYNRVPVQDYLALLNELRAKNNQLAADLGAQAFINREALPSYANAKAGEMEASVATSGNVNLTPLVGRVEGVRVKIVEALSQVRFANIMGKNDRPVKLTDPFNPDLSGMDFLDGKDVKTITQEIKDDLTPGRDTKSLLAADISTTIASIQSFVNQLGTKSYLTFESIVDSDNGRKETVREALVKIQNHFFQRSYLRKKLRYRLGTFRVAEYEQNLFRGDLILKQPIKEIPNLFKNQIVLEDNDITDAFNNARQWYRLFDSKTSGVIKSSAEMNAREGKDDKYANRETGLSVRFNTFITNATGQQEVAEVARMIVQLLLADIREEQMLAAFEFEDVAKYHDVRFRSTPEARELTNKKMCQMDWTLPDVVFQPNQPCGKLNIRKPQQPVSLSGTAANLYSDILYQVTYQEAFKRTRAENKRKLLDAQLEANKTPEQRQQEVRDAIDSFN